MARPDRLREGAAAPVDAAVTAFERDQWAELARTAGHWLTDLELDGLGATGEQLERDEVLAIYVPLAELVGHLLDARRAAQQVVDRFLGDERSPTPFMIGIAGGVAVGKSTTARVLQALLRARDGSARVELLTTDGFLLPNEELERRGLMDRKGFPESYDRHGLVSTLALLRAGAPEVVTPVYSHLHYDVVPGERQVIHRPDVLIVEGLSVLQTPSGATPGEVLVADFFDLAVYVDAAESDMAGWFTDRLLALCESARTQPDAYLHRFSGLAEADLRALAREVWAGINLVNLRENVAPTRARAHVVVEKGSDHRVRRVVLRRW
jgi:type I pantothenate kinase